MKMKWTFSVKLTDFHVTFSEILARAGFMWMVMAVSIQTSILY